MNKKTKIEFVKTFTESLADSIIHDIESGNIPEEWDGIELRWLLEERATSSFGKDSGKRKREYKNTVLVNNL